MCFHISVRYSWWLWPRVFWWLQCLEDLFIFCHSFVYGLMQQFRLNGASAECLAQALLPCSVCVYEGMVGLPELAEWCGASCLLIFCNFHLTFLLPSVYFWLSIIFNVLEFYLRNTPKNTAFQTQAILLLQTLKITYLGKWDFFGKCLMCLIRSFALYQIAYSCQILVFLTLFLHRPEAKFGWSELTKSPSWAGASVTTTSTALRLETQLSPCWNGTRTWNQ